MKTTRFLLLGILLGFIGGTFLSWADDLEFSDLPEKVAQTFQKRFPNAQVREVRIEGEKEDRYYEVEFRMPDDNREIEVELTPEGLITEMEEQISEPEIPERVMKSLRKVFPKCEVRRALQYSKIETFYELDIQTGKKKHEVKINARGRVLEIERD